MTHFDPYARISDDRWLFEARLELGMRRAASHAKVAGIAGAVLNLGRLLGRCELGVREAERDRRRYPRREWRFMVAIDPARDRDAIVFVNTRTGALATVTGLEVSREEEKLRADIERVSGLLLCDHENMPDGVCPCCDEYVFEGLICTHEITSYGRCAGCGADLEELR